MLPTRAGQRLADELDHRRAHHALKLCVAHSSGLAELLRFNQRLNREDGLECLRPKTCF